MLSSQPGNRVLVAGGVLAITAVAVATGVGLVGIPLAGGTSASVAPRFVEETATSGIDHAYDGPYVFYTGGGVAVLDCDGDRRPDLYVAGGAGPASVFRNESATGGALRFARVAAPEAELTAVTGAYPLDMDADGLADLAVLRVSRSELLRGTGDCRFEALGDTLGMVPHEGWTTAFSATWEDDGALPTLAFGRYALQNEVGTAVGCLDSALVRPDASGRRYAPPVVLSPGHCTLSMLFSDWDGSGRRDLRVSNDRQYYRDGQEQLWRVAPGEAPRLYTADDGWVPLRIWGMGIASQDLTADGLPEVYLTSQGANKLQVLEGGPDRPTYRNMAFEAGVEGAQPYAGGQPLPSTAWHPEFVDVNNDALMDLFVSKGNVHSMPDYASRDPSNLFIGQRDGVFTEGAETAGIVSFDRGRGAALADLNLDGLPDLVVVNLGAPVRTWRNVGSGTAEAPVATGRWLQVRLSQPGGNRDAVGAVVEVEAGGTTVRRELVVGGGHAGGQLGWTHVGVGEAATARLRVTWPDGEVGPWLDVATNQFLDVARDAPAPVPWAPPA